MNSIGRTGSEIGEIIANGVQKAVVEGICKGIEGSFGIMVYSGITISLVTGGVLLEGAALSGAKALKENQTTAAKASKCVLAVLALIGALAVSVGLGLFSAMFIANFPYSISEQAEKIGFLAGAAVVLGTLSLHLKAFRLSGLI
jgi:hypothetical protein